MTIDVEALLADANMPSASYRLCLNADLHQAWEDAEAAARRAAAVLERAQKADEPTATAATDAAEATRAAEALRAQVEASSLPLKFRALSSAAFNSLQLRHPPRKDVESDKAIGFNPNTFWPALAHISTEEPASLTAEQWSRIFEKLTDRQVEDLCAPLIRINRRETTSVPFSSPASGRTTA